MHLSDDDGWLPCFLFRISLLAKLVSWISIFHHKYMISISKDGIIHKFNRCGVDIPSISIIGCRFDPPIFGDSTPIKKGITKCRWYLFYNDGYWWFGNPCHLLYPKTIPIILLRLWHVAKFHSLPIIWCSRAKACIDIEIALLSAIEIEGIHQGTAIMNERNQQYNNNG